MRPQNVPSRSVPKAFSREADPAAGIRAVLFAREDMTAREQDEERREG